MQSDITDEQNLLKTKGEKINLELDDCDIKENNYYKDITNRGMSRFSIAESGYKEQYIEQSVIVYHHKKGNTIEDFISQPFSLNSITLASHILNKEIILFVDRFDRSKYIFEFNPNPAK